MTTTADEAAQALAAVRTSREKLAALTEPTPARHLAFAAVMGALVAAPALPNTALRGAAVAVAMSAVVLIVSWDRQRTGTFVNGYRAGRTRPLTVLLMAVLLGLYAASAWCGIGLGLAWPSLAMAALTVPVAYVGSVWWQAVFRREMAAAA